jgi:diphthine methyl ester synthase
MLTIIGTGLCDAQDLTQRGLAAIHAADHVYLEGYTSLLQSSIGEFSAVVGKPIQVLSRTDVESDIDRVLTQAKNSNVALLVIGDPFAATTHADLYLRAKQAGVTVHVIHNATILSAIGAVGLELYRYGKTVSIPYWERGFEPTSFLDGIKENYERGLHTLCLLDIKVDQHRFMSVKEGIEHLERAQERTNKILTSQTLAVGVARMGCSDTKIAAGTLNVLKEVDFGKPPHALVIPGKLHPVEEEMLALWRIKNS